MKTLTLRPIGAGQAIEIDAVRVMSDKTLSEAHRNIMAITPRTQQERQKVCAILAEIKRRGRLRR